MAGMRIVTVPTLPAVTPGVAGVVFRLRQAGVADQHWVAGRDAAGAYVWVRIDLPADAPVAATYITQTPHAGLSAEQALSALSTGVLKSTTGTGVVSIAALADLAAVTVRKNTGADVGTRARLNLIEGTNVTLTVADDAGSGEVDVTIASTGGGGGPNVEEEDVLKVTAASVLDFDGSDFNVTDEGGGEARIALAYGTGAGTPAEGNHTHAGGSGPNVEEEDVLKVTAATVLDFDGSDFNVTDEGAGEARIALAYGTGAGTPAEGNHAHANDHVAATVLDTASIDMSIAGQQISAAAIFGTGAGVVAEGNHLHDATYVNVDGDTMTGQLKIQLDHNFGFLVNDAAANNLLSIATIVRALNLFGGMDLSMKSLAGATTFFVDGDTGTIQLQASTKILTGTGSPEGTVSATIGSLYLSWDGVGTPTLYTKESDNLGNTGWVAMLSEGSTTITDLTNDVSEVELLRLRVQKIETALTVLGIDATDDAWLGAVA